MGSKENKVDCRWCQKNGKVEGHNGNSRQNSLETCRQCPIITQTTTSQPKPGCMLCEFFSWKVLLTDVPLILGRVRYPNSSSRQGWFKSVNSSLNTLREGNGFQAWPVVGSWKTSLFESSPEYTNTKPALSNGNVYFLYPALEFCAKISSGTGLADLVSKCHSPVFTFCAAILVPSARRKTLSSLLFSVVEASFVCRQPCLRQNIGEGSRLNLRCLVT